MGGRAGGGVPGLVEFGEDGEHAEIVAMSTCEWLRVVLNASLVGLRYGVAAAWRRRRRGGGGENSKHIFRSVVKVSSVHWSLVVFFRFFLHKHKI